MNKEDKVETWAIVELLGHQRIAGFITEQPVAGTNMLRVDVPETHQSPSFTRLIGGSAIYAINPCTEEVAKYVAANLNVKPIESWDINKVIAKRNELPANAATNHTGDGDEDEDSHF